MTKLILAVVLVAAAFLPASADIVVTGEGERGMQKIYIKSDALRFDYAERGDAGTIIFKKAAGGVITIISRDAGTYFEMTPEDVVAMKKMIEQTMKMMEQMLKSVPEAQREEMRSRMKQHEAMAAVEPKIVLERSGERINNWVCDKYVIYHGDRKFGEVWFAEPGQLGLRARDFEILKEFEKFWEPLASMGSQQASMLFFAEGEKGFPVKMNAISEEGRATTTFKAARITRQAVDASVFAIPEGMRRVDMPFSGR